MLARADRLRLEDARELYSQQEPGDRGMDQMQHRGGARSSRPLSGHERAPAAASSI